MRVAGIHFSFCNPLDASLLLPSFQPFLTQAGPADLTCSVAGPELDDALARMPVAPDEPWAFKRTADGFEVIRRNRAGHVLWRITGPDPFESATILWHPERFIRYYGSFERTLGQGIGLVLLTLRLLTHRGFVLHASAAELDGAGILCAGVSGRGKSTLARLLDSAGATVLSDERPVVRQWPIPGADAAPPPPTFRVYGSPWPSSANMARNAWVPLRRIYFLEHGSDNRITPLEPIEALRRLIPVATVPWQSPELLDPLLETIGALVAGIPCAVFSFRPEPDAVEAIRDDLANGRNE
jgi:hypothetical protein